MELRDLIARAACADCEGAEYVGQKVVFEDGTRHQMWEAYLTTADAILAALDDAGLVVVPNKATGGMLGEIEALPLVAYAAADAATLAAYADADAEHCRIIREVVPAIEHAEKITR
jgi:hypothetical protein